MGAGVVSRKMAAVVPAVIPSTAHFTTSAERAADKGISGSWRRRLIDTLMLAGDSPLASLVSKALNRRSPPAAGSFRKVWKLTEQIS